jgi:hypothetical protein
MLEAVSPFTAFNPPSAPRPDLKELTTSLNPLRGHVSAIHAAALFHLFSEEQQLHLARALAGLLSPEPGSIIFGEHVTQPVTGRHRMSDDKLDTMFTYNPESWESLWKGIFEEGTVRVETVMREVSKPDFTRVDHFYRLSWSVTRL